MPTSRRPMIIGISVALIALLLAGGSFWWFSHRNSGQTSGPLTLVTLPGHTVDALLAGKDLGPVAGDSLFTLTFNVAVKDQAALQSIADGVNDPNSPNYQKYPSSDELASRFGVTTDQVNQLKQYLTDNQVVIQDLQLTGQSITFTTDAASISRGLHTDIHTYQVDADQYVGPTKDPEVPQTLAAFINHIDGLDNYPQNFGQMVSASTKANATSYSLTQLRHFYNADTLSGIDGTGQTIAVLEFSDFLDADVQHYGLPSSSYQRITVKSGPQNGKTNLSGAVEVELDMEVIYGIAPGAKQIIYVFPQSTGLDTALNQIVTDHKANIVSISWGTCEQYLINHKAQSILNNINTTLTKGASLGMTFLAASGDNGAFGCYRQNFSRTLSVGVPASAPYATAVGGTTIDSLDTPYNPGHSESTWSCVLLACGSPEGSGGGVSKYYALPTYQKNVTKPRDAGSTGRYVPDIAANADPATGYQIYCTAKGCGQASSSQSNMVVGGTSAAAPLWAASLALVDQYLAQKNKKIGNLNQLIYSLAPASKTAAAFHDITTGNNLHYNAGPGFNLTTGWGSLDVAKLAQAIDTGTA